MEIEKDGGGRGLVKIGKAVTMEKALKGRTVVDGILRIFIVPKTKVTSWVTEWKKLNNETS